MKKLLRRISRALFSKRTRISFKGFVYPGENKTIVEIGYHWSPEHMDKVDRVITSYLPPLPLSFSSGDEVEIVIKKRKSMHNEKTE